MNRFTPLAVCASVSVLAISAFADGPQAVEQQQLRVISGIEARNSLGSIADFGGNRARGKSLPLWSYSTVATQNGTSYTGMIVGSQPPASATVPTVLIPVIINITFTNRQAGTTTTYSFDPTQPDVGCLGAANTGFGLMQASPLFNNATFSFNGKSIGPTQYADAFLRGEFFGASANTASPLLTLSTTVGAPLTISINAGSSGNNTADVFTLKGTQCGTPTNLVNPGGMLAVVNINTIDSDLQNYIKANNLNATQFPFFVTYNAVMSVGAATNTRNCCVLGYHNAEGSPGQTYGIAEFEGRDQTAFTGVADVSGASHEVNEWANDPTGTNPTPAWGGIGQVSGCQSNFEVGDPLSGTLMPTVTLNGFTYHLQELAYFGWFYGATGGGYGGAYSNNGTFKGAAKLCPPGGTN